MWNILTLLGISNCHCNLLSASRYPKLKQADFEQVLSWVPNLGVLSVKGCELLNLPRVISVLPIRLRSLDVGNTRNVWALEGNQNKHSRRKEKGKCATPTGDALPMLSALHGETRKTFPNLHRLLLDYCGWLLDCDLASLRFLFLPKMSLNAHFFF